MNTIILTLADFKAQWNIANSNNEDESRDVALTNYIADATNQIDNLCSGKVFKEWEKLDETKLYKLKRAIGDLTLLLDQTGKLYFDGNRSGGGSAPFSLNAVSSNNSVEVKRQDIIKSLIETGLYSNLETFKAYNSVDKDSNVSKDIAKLISTLNNEYLRRDGTNDFDGNTLKLTSNKEISGSGDIIGSPFIDENGDTRNPTITGYDIPYTNTKSLESDKILDTRDNTYKYLSDISDIAYLGNQPTNAATNADLNLVESQLVNKQDKLTVGTGISIDSNNVISATGTGGVSKEYVDNADNALKRRIDTNQAAIGGKQDLLNAGRGIEISGNTISATGGGGDVTKTYVDAQDQKLSDRIDTEEVKINATIQDVNTLENTTTQLEVDVLTNQTLIATNTNEVLSVKQGLLTANRDIRRNTNKINANETSITTLDSAAVKLTGDQDIGGKKTFTDETTFADIIWSNRDVANGKIKLETGTAAGFIEFFHGTGNTRFGVIGRTSSSNQHLTIETFDNKNLVLKSAAGISVNKPIAGQTPTAGDHLATKDYVDNSSGGGSSYTAGDGINISGSNEISTTLAGEIKGVEKDTGMKYDGNIIYSKTIQIGDPYGNPVVDIAASGDLVSGVQYFLGLDWGIIVRGSNRQIHNINAVTNSPDAHASIVYQNSNKISYWFNGSMTLSDFKNKPFIVRVLYTKQ